MNRPSPDDMNDIIMAEQREEIKELKRENENLLYEIKCGYKNRKEIDKRMLELEKENEKLKEEGRTAKQLYWKRDMAKDKEEKNKYLSKLEEIMGDDSYC